MLKQMRDMNILWKLFLTFAKIGLFTFGGGYAMIAIIEEHCVGKKAWLTHEDLANMIVVAESTPGPIAINCATFVGYKIAGIPGAVVSTLGMVLPSFLIIYLISRGFENFLEVTLVANAFRGIKIAVGLLILDAGIMMVKKMHNKKLPRTIMVCSCIIMLCINLFAWNFSSISLMLIAAVVSLTIFVLNGAPEQKGGAKK